MDPGVPRYTSFVEKPFLERTKKNKFSPQPQRSFTHIAHHHQSSNIVTDEVAGFTLHQFHQSSNIVKEAVPCSV